MDTVAGIETELKWALDPAAYARLGRALAHAYGPGERLVQRNRFLDSADLRLRRAKLNLRLRLENGALMMTCKRKRADAHDGLHQNDEWECRLDPALWQQRRRGLDPAALPLPEPHRAALAGARLADHGGFANLRRVWRVEGDLLCLDRTRFADRIDHELEIETAAPARARTRWAERLAAWGVAWAPQPATKFARFLALAAR